MQHQVNRCAYLAAIDDIVLGADSLPSDLEHVRNARLTATHNPHGMVLFTDGVPKGIVPYPWPP
jgi:hypothetical protein